MRTTVDLPDDLFRSLKVRAGLRGASLKEVMASVIAAGLRAEPEPKGDARRSPPPVAVPSAGKPLNITPELLRRLDERDDLESYARSFGRQRVVGAQRP
ncbi:MAG TPA: hypothetical protein VNE83_06995 [Terriglobales bacterium]|nr:hypothetical protein [Terriglobales bacterium]